MCLVWVGSEPAPRRCALSGREVGGRAGPGGLTAACRPLAEKASWLGEQPQFWSKAQVLDWISYQVEKNKFDASTIDFSRCDMDGATLCGCAREELRLVFGPLGDQLYSQLWDHSESRPSEGGWPRRWPRVPGPGRPEPPRLSRAGRTPARALTAPTLLGSPQLSRRAELDHRPAGEGQRVLPGDAGGPGPLW